MMKIFKGFAADESGVTAMEYGMIAALISVVIITTLGHVGIALDKTFSLIQQALEKANAKAP